MSLPHGYDAETARAMVAMALGRTRPPKEFETSDEMIAEAKKVTDEQFLQENRERRRKTGARLAAERHAARQGQPTTLDQRVDAFVKELGEGR